MPCLLLGLAAWAGLSQAAPSESRIRIVPQYSAGFVQDIEESKDGTRLLTHDKGYAPRLWDAKRQVLVRVLDGHPDAVALANFSPDGSRLLTRSPRLVRVWDSGRAKVLADFPITKGELATAAAFSPDGKTVAVGTDKGTVSIHGLGEPHKLGAHAKAVRSLAFSPDGARLASGADDGTGRFWDVKTEKPLTAINGHKGAIRWLDFSPRGELLATSFDNTASLWDASGKAMATYPHFVGERGVDNVAMAAVFVGKDLSEVAACASDGTIQLYKPGATTPSRALKGHTRSIRELRKSHDGRFVATYANDESLRIWDVVAGKEIPSNAGEGEPTAGEFSPNRDVWWLGYYGGEVRQFDIKTGTATKETLGAVSPVAYASLNGENSVVHWKGELASAMVGSLSIRQFLLNPSETAKPLGFYMSIDESAISPDGRYMAVNARDNESKFILFEATTGTFVLTAKKMLEFAFSPDSTRVVTMDGEDGNAGVYDLKQRKFLASWKWPVDKDLGGITDPVWHPNGDWLITFWHPGHEIVMWDAVSGKIVRSLGTFKDNVASAWFADGGKRMVVVGMSDIAAIDLETGKRLWTASRHSVVHSMPSSSKDGRVGAYTSYDEAKDESFSVVIDSANGAELLRVPKADSIALSVDGKLAITSQGLMATVWDVATKKAVRTLKHASLLVNAGFGPEGNRPVTVDRLEGLHVWSESGQRLANFVAMNDGGWLAYDDQGRYDASDPSEVNGASFVLEWEGGLEPISMPQLKGQFYEPHLLAKALGIDKEPLREVPSLESLHLFPSLTVKKSEGLVYEVESKDRDGGGIGTVRVSINGKEVAHKKGTGFFKLDLEPYKNFLLPETLLTNGAKNLLSVTVSNEAGDLVSPPEVLDIGVPADLKAPDIHLYALCAGIGDYAGKAGDLQAPPGDATAIGKALKEVSDRLLPGKTEIDVMTTSGEDKRPTRKNILGWLKEVGAKATSSDIVFLFVAGHGTNKIGEGSGYYMLTPEADPGDITPATAKTGAISGEELRQALASIPAGKQVVVLDTCHSGAATSSLLASDRSVSGEYQRAWEAIKDTTGTWLLAGAAADQKSYESPNVDHGMLTYALLEAVDKASADGLRKTPSGELFVDVERWLDYAANRVESLKSEVGIKGVQRPEFKRATRGATFDIGVMDEKRKGFLDLKAPLPIVIVGDFEQDQEDPLNLEDAVAAAMKDAKGVKAWFEVAKHPGVYRMTGEYTVSGEDVKVRLILQAFDERQQRKNLETVELVGAKDKLAELATKIRSEIETRIKGLEKKEAKAGS